MKKLQIVNAVNVPQEIEGDTILFLPSVERGISYYRERTDRNLGWITQFEQEEVIRNSTITIAGTGGMGGQASQILVRLGVGRIRIADPEVFDLSNLNRQLGATSETVGKSKVLETARVLRRITDDFLLEVYPQGISSESLPYIVPGSDLIIDEIEFWNIAACIRMHQYARRLGIPILNCLTVGFATFLHYFTADSMPVEEMLGMDLNKAEELEDSFLSGLLSQTEQQSLMEQIFSCFIPSLPRYFKEDVLNLAVTERLAKEGKAPIIATNPSMASGFVANRALLTLLELKSPTKRIIKPLPKSPGYVWLDAATYEFEVVEHR